MLTICGQISTIGNMKYILVLSSKSKKSLKRLHSNRNFDKSNFKKVIEILLNKEALPIKYKNHKLQGEYEGTMECHLQNDILLIYYYKDEELVLYVVDIDSHSELF